MDTSSWKTKLKSSKFYIVTKFVCSLCLMLMCPVAYILCLCSIITGLGWLLWINGQTLNDLPSVVVNFIMDVDASSAAAPKSRQKRKQSTSPPAEVRCFDVIKQLACSVNCGGKTISIKETEPITCSSSASDTSIPEKKKTLRKRKKSNQSSKTKLKRGHVSPHLSPETDKRPEKNPDQHQSLAWAKRVNMAALDWNMVTMDLQRSVNNLALYVLESMSAPTWVPTFLPQLDVSKLPPGYEDSTENSVMSDQQSPSNQGAKKPPKKKKKSEDKP